MKNCQLLLSEFVSRLLRYLIQLDDAAKVQRGCAALIFSGTTAAAILFILTAIFPMVQPPVAAYSAKTRAAGANVFHERGCEHCHGADGAGTDRGPDLSGVGKRWHKDRIEGQIRNGGGGMPAFGGILEQAEVTDLVDYISAKRKPVKPGPPRPGVVPKVIEDGAAQ